MQPEWKEDNGEDALREVEDWKQQELCNGPKGGQDEGECQEELGGRPPERVEEGGEDGPRVCSHGSNGPVYEGSA